jgi:hypothetical protein
MNQPPHIPNADNFLRLAVWSLFSLQVKLQEAITIISQNQVQPLLMQSLDLANTVFIETRRIENMIPRIITLSEEQKLALRGMIQETYVVITLLIDSRVH